MGLEGEETEVVKKKAKKIKEKSKKGKKDEVSGNWIYEAEHRSNEVVTEGARSAEKENDKRGDNERKKKKNEENKGGIEESNDGYCERAGNDTEKESDIHGEKNHDRNVIENVERKKKRKKRENDKSRVSDTQLQQQNFEDVVDQSTSEEIPNELQNGTNVEPVGQGLDRNVTIMDHKKKKKKSKKPEGNLDLGSVQQDRTFLTKHEMHYNNQRGEAVEVSDEGCDPKRKGEKKGKRKREKDKSIVSEVELRGHDFDDPEDKNQSIIDERDHNELQEEEVIAAITQASEGDVVEKDENKGKKKRKKTKGDSGSDGMNLELDGAKGKKENTKSIGNGSKDSKPEKGKKKVTFSGKDEVFPLSEDNLVRGKRFSKEEDEMVKAAVFKYIEENGLGEEGLKMVLNCKSHSKIRDCWKEIGSALPHRPQSAVYYRAQILFRRDEKHKWTEEEIEMLRKFQKKHGNQWKILADELGKHRVHVKDTWRRIKPSNLKKGRWSQEEYQALFDLVNLDLRLKYSEEKKSKHGMLRDNVPWTTISDKLTSRSCSTSCYKWYYQLTSPMVMEGDWADSDDYRLIDKLFELDASCYEDVDWDNLIEHRSGAVCQKRWNEMVLHIGDNLKRSFADQVEVLAKQYCPELLKAREDWDSKPYVP